MLHLPDLDWQPVLLLKLHHTPFSAIPHGFSLQRLYLASTPDGVFSVPWDTPHNTRCFPIAKPVGWLPDEDMPFELPIRFQRRRPGLSCIPNGTWILPYNHSHYEIYRHAQVNLNQLLQTIAERPTHPQTLHLLLNSFTFEGA